MISLSYIIATRNRLPLLKITLERLLNELQPGEEIVVVDGDSTDGAKEYLQQLFNEGHIHQFISEPDNNQAHGWNKAMLMAKGTIIKKIIDDDVYNYTAIRQCKNYMLANPQVDLCISNCLTTNILTPQTITEANRLEQYKKWQNGEVKSFTFSDVSMLIRKSALSYLGLFDTQFSMMDWEYALRCSWLRANIAYYTGYNSLSVGTPGNVTSKTSEARLKREGKIGMRKYEYFGDRADISLYSELKIAVGKVLFHKKYDPYADVNQLKAISDPELKEIYNSLYHHLEAYNQSRSGDFIL
ncbi:glycosyltransferase [Mucilaginibacter mali]|uniref:Glycosyltransferase n=1 Tax=Mucilaginibacter mali TaxID=2740462 RepID=A0A7D4UPF9_9SPHI|nr:glycosyltransferase [Mucilaginibacter mali]QKJ30440.1 glycosyltransferase [Mucilaginibacter mali]